MGEIDKVVSLLGFLAPWIPGTRKQNRPLGCRPGRCQIFPPYSRFWKMIGEELFLC